MGGQAKGLDGKKAGLRHRCDSAAGVAGQAGQGSGCCCWRGQTGLGLPAVQAAWGRPGQQAGRQAACIEGGPPSAASQMAGAAPPRLALAAFPLTDLTTRPPLGLLLWSSTCAREGRLVAQDGGGGGGGGRDGSGDALRGSMMQPPLHALPALAGNLRTRPSGFSTSTVICWPPRPVERASTVAALRARADTRAPLWARGTESLAVPAKKEERLAAETQATGRATQLVVAATADAIAGGDARRPTLRAAGVDCDGGGDGAMRWCNIMASALSWPPLSCRPPATHSPLAIPPILPRR